jgi:hypothetical protein
MPTPAHMLVIEEKEFGESRYGRPRVSLDV